MEGATPTKMRKIDRLRIQVPATKKGIEGEPPAAQMSSAPVYIDICFRSVAPSSNSFRFNSGWLSYSSVLGVKTVLFDAVSELVRSSCSSSSSSSSSCCSSSSSREASNKQAKLLGHRVFEGGWKDVTELTMNGTEKEQTEALSKTSTMMMRLGVANSNRHEIKTEVKVVMTLVPSPSLTVPDLLESVSGMFVTKGQEYFILQVMLDLMLEEEDGKDLTPDDKGGGDDEDEIVDAGGGSSWSFDKDESGLEGEDSDEDEDEILWLDDEKQSMRVLFPPSVDSGSAARTPPSPSCLANPVVLKLLPAYMLPPPVIRLRIPFTQHTMDIFQKPYTAYHMFLKQGRLSWRVVKRYSDFAEFKEKLEKNDAGVRKLDLDGLPLLPSKTLPIAKVAMSETVVQKRRLGLERYMKDLLKLPGATDNVEVLSFLGVVNSSRHITTKPSKTKSSKELTQPSEPTRGVIHISQLRGMIKWGDLVLFRCANSVSAAQRLATGAEWDHVALVVKRRFSRTLELLESTGDGVAVYPLVSRLKAYGTEFTNYMAVRSLVHTRTFQEFEAMCDFTDSVLGVPYGFNFRKLFGAIGINKKIGMGTKDKDKGDEKVDDEETEKPGQGSITRNNINSMGRETEESSGTVSNVQTSSTEKPHGSGMGGIAGVGTLISFSDKKDYFCSELIAAALKAMGIMYDRRNELYFWPGEFGKGGSLDKSLIEECEYGEEMIIDCKVLEIGSARVSVQHETNSEGVDEGGVY
ncbi:hypothetical protein TrST_g13862 [Triparma strigata]|uniref:PX domain-containing protein n=1 Tax=Triparma strigata TaxID=1606541 RepID=A0A9W7AWC7_9STRA|nr:hypothetical protein TrST_g13862 [Triparma strigata]